MKQLAALAIALFLFLSVRAADAQGWDTRIDSHSYVPPRLLAIDKASQTFYLLERKSPIHVLSSFPCATGQADGDKRLEGDKRTPEGLYFVERRIRTDDLDYTLYGESAHALNFPNPVDRIKGKTGYGIWIHGRGKELLPRDTRGCVALSNHDILSIDTNLTNGMPVVIADRVSWNPDPGQSEAVADELVEQVIDWAANWQGRNDDFFAHYDPDRFALSERSPFRAFRDHKERIFRSQPWIQVMVDNIHAMQGPDYWVTWFDQYYRTPDLTSLTGKRFYWQRNDAGEWRIVGREYTDASPDLERHYLANKRIEIQPLLHGWLEAWKNADPAAYAAYYGKEARQDSRRGLDDIRAYKARLWQDKAPSEIDIDDVSVEPDSQGLRVTFTQTYRDVTGYEDHGIKTLVLTPEGGAWHIIDEQWRKLS